MLRRFALPPVPACYFQAWNTPPAHPPSPWSSSVSSMPSPSAQPLRAPPKRTASVASPSTAGSRPTRCSPPPPSCCVPPCARNPRFLPPADVPGCNRMQHDLQNCEDVAPAACDPAPPRNPPSLPPGRNQMQHDLTNRGAVAPAPMRSPRPILQRSPERQTRGPATSRVQIYLTIPMKSTKLVVRDRPVQDWRARSLNDLTVCVLIGAWQRSTRKRCKYGQNPLSLHQISIISLRSSTRNANRSNLDSCVSLAMVGQARVIVNVTFRLLCCLCSLPLMFHWTRRAKRSIGLTVRFSPMTLAFTECRKTPKSDDHLVISSPNTQGYLIRNTQSKSWEGSIASRLFREPYKSPWMRFMESRFTSALIRGNG